MKNGIDEKRPSRKNSNVKVRYTISSNKSRASNKHHPLISTAPLGIHIEISASPLISAAPLNAALTEIVTISY